MLNVNCEKFIEKLILNYLEFSYKWAIYRTVAIEEANFILSNLLSTKISDLFYFEFDMLKEMIK